MLGANDLFNEIMVLPPDKRDAVWRIMECDGDRLVPRPEGKHNPEHSDFYCYVVDGIQYHYGYDTSLNFYLEHLDDDIRNWVCDGYVPNPVLAKERLIAAFHAVQQDMLRLGWDGDYSREPTVFHLPCPAIEPFELGFVWKQHRNGLTFVASPLPLPWLGEAIIQKGDKR